MYLLLLVLVVSFAVTFVSTPVLIRKFRDAGIVGRDVHKHYGPKIPEMGGLAIVAGMVAGVMLAIMFATLSGSGLINPDHALKFDNLMEVFAAVTTILIIAIIGMFDDLVRIRQSIKAILPVFAAIPLIAVSAGHPYITLPFFGALYLPLIYPLFLIPFGVTVASNVTNMLAGFNGLEAGMGLVACSSLAIIAWDLNRPDALVLMLAMVGALLAFLFFNWYPARIFPGDVGTLSIGAAIAAAVIIGNFESVGLVITIPYFVDLIFKVKNRFPKEIELTRLVGDKLVCREIVGLPSLLMNVFNGIREKQLVIILVATEAFFGIIAVLIW
ncbi:MAG: hypothetical protein JXB14_05280 [Candidatus Altiarchaeota archaeon]|nr:hypothetical protein [Candidatus Altiarchaeota archaeon]